MQDIVKIVLTGGPCGGKTSALEMLKGRLLKKGYNVILVQEVATELLSKGITPDVLGRKDFQKKILQWQIEKEKIIERNLKEERNGGIIICDRGTLDGQAFCEMYWDEGNISGTQLFYEIVDELGITEQELYLRYNQVIHFISTAVDLQSEYNPETNLMRKEDINQAIEADKILQRIWSKHPNVCILDNSTNLEEKVDRALKEILIEIDKTQKKGEKMENVINKEEAVNIIKEYADLLMEYEDEGISGVFLVGSLADGNYVPGKSDLDVSVIIKNDADLEKINGISNNIIESLKNKYNITIDFEAFIKKEEMLMAPYYPELQKTVELMRIRNQAKMIEGTFNQESIPVPLNYFFIADEQYAEAKLEKKYGEDYIGKMTAKQQFNYIVNYMRLKNFLDKGEFLFNKKEIISKFLEDETETERMLQIMNDKDKEKYKEFLLGFAMECKQNKHGLIHNGLEKNESNVNR